MNHMIRTTLAASLLSLGACYFDLDRSEGGGGDDWTAPEPYYGGSWSELRASDGILDGELGNVELTGEARVAEAYTWGTGATIDLRQSGRGGAAMNALTVDGISLENLAAGTYVTDGGAWGRSSSESDIYFSVIGCAGPSEGNWELDLPAERVEVQVAELEPGVQQITWVATFDVDGPRVQETTGSAVVRH